MKKAIEELKNVIYELKSKRNNIDLKINVIEESIEALYSAEDICPKCKGAKFFNQFTSIGSTSGTSVSVNSSVGCDRCNASGRYVELKSV